MFVYLSLSGLGFVTLLPHMVSNGVRLAHWLPVGEDFNVCFVQMIFVSRFTWCALHVNSVHIYHQECHGGR